MNDKAKELIDRFYYSITNDGTSEGCELAYKDAIKCAIIAVEELMSNCFEQHHWEYWQEVKKELEAMK